MNENLKNAIIRGSIMKRTWCNFYYEWRTYNINR